jgi:hypothetical protein
MANTNAPFGFRWLGLNNSPTTPSDVLIERKVAAANTNKLYAGDLVINLDTGYVDKPTGTPVTSAVSDYAGVFAGCEYLSVSQGRRIVSKYWPGGDNSGDVTVQLIPLTGVTPPLFVAQTLLTSAAFADIGLNVRPSYLAGTAYSGYSKSGMTISMATAAAANPTYPFQIVDLWSNRSAPGQPGTDDTTNYNWVVVAFNGQQLAGL